MTISAFFHSLGASLNNTRWSWGAEHPKTGDIYFRVWTDELATIQGVMCARLTHHAAFTSKPSDNGYRERQEHVAKVKQGAKAYVVLCHDPARAVSGKPRRIHSHCNSVILGVRIRFLGGDDWLEI